VLGSPSVGLHIFIGAAFLLDNNFFPLVLGAKFCRRRASLFNRQNPKMNLENNILLVFLRDWKVDKCSWRKKLDKEMKTLPGTGGKLSGLCQPADSFAWSA
jgi:hypothetical protein